MQPSASLDYQPKGSVICCLVLTDAEPSPGLTSNQPVTIASTTTIATTTVPEPRLSSTLSFYSTSPSSCSSPSPPCSSCYSSPTPPVSKTRKQSYRHIPQSPPTTVKPFYKQSSLPSQATSDRVKPLYRQTSTPNTTHCQHYTEAVKPSYKQSSKPSKLQPETVKPVNRQSPTSSPVATKSHKHYHKEDSLILESAHSNRRSSPTSSCSSLPVDDLLNSSSITFSYSELLSTTSLSLPSALLTDPESDLDSAAGAAEKPCSLGLAEPCLNTTRVSQIESGRFCSLGDSCVGSRNSTSSSASSGSSGDPRLFIDPRNIRTSSSPASSPDDKGARLSPRRRPEGAAKGDKLRVGQSEYQHHHHHHNQKQQHRIRVLPLVTSSSTGVGSASINNDTRLGKGTIPGTDQSSCGKTTIQVLGGVQIIPFEEVTGSVDRSFKSAQSQFKVIKNQDTVEHSIKYPVASSRTDIEVTITQICPKTSIVGSADTDSTSGSNPSKVCDLDIDLGGDSYKPSPALFQVIQASGAGGPASYKAVKGKSTRQKFGNYTYVKLLQQYQPQPQQQQQK